MTNTEKKGIFINVIYTNRNQDKKTIVMNLRHYLQAKRVRPDFYEPADEKAKKVVSKFPIDLIPAGTTMQDVELYEQSKGSIKGKRTSKFDQLIDAMENGLDVSDLTDVQMIQEKAPVMKQASENVDDLLDEFKDKVKAPRPEPAGELGKNDYTRDDLNMMDDEQINALLATLPIAKKMKDQIQRLKDKSIKRDQIFTLLSSKKK